jgi:AcrR family transcriptional regulator
MRIAGSKNRATPERRRAILDGALAVFLERGFEQATLDAICSRLDTSRGSIYHHFSSKEEIAVTLYAEAIESIQQDVRAALAGAATARAGVEQLVEVYLRWFERQPELGVFVFRILDGHALDEQVEPIRRLQREFVCSATASFASFVERGEVRRLSPQLYASIVVGPSRDFLRAWLVTRDPDALQEALRELPAAAWRGVACGAPGGEDDQRRR